MPSWLETFILDAAREAAGGGSGAFDAEIAARLKEVPLSGWEVERWTRGLQHGLVRLDGPWFQLGSGGRRSFGLFLRDREGGIAGLHREALTQAAAYVAWITDYGYPRGLVRFEFGYMDVALRDSRGKVLAYAETKASTRTLDSLVARLRRDFEGGLPDLDEGERDDAYRKAEHILDNRAGFFWGVSPEERLPYRVRFTDFGFALDPLEDFPRKEHLRTIRE